MKRVFVVMLILGFGILLNAQQKALEAYISEAQALKGEGKFQEAVEILKEAVDIYPREVDAHLQLGLAWGDFCQKAGETGDMMGAMNGANGFFSEMEEVLELDPKNYDAHFYFGVWGVNVPSFFGKLDAGVKHLEKALSIAKGQSGEGSQERLATIYRFLGQGYRMQERFEDAKTAWGKALELSPEGEIGDAARVGLESLEEVRAAAKPKKPEKKEESEKVLALKKKLEKSPDDFELLMELGKACFEEENWVEATAIFKKAVELKPEHAEAQFLLARLVSEDAAKDYDERIYENTDLRTGLAFETAQQLERALQLDPTNSEVKLYYAVSCVEMPFFVGRIDKGLLLLEELVKDENVPEEMRTEALYQLGYGYRKKGTAVWMKLVKDFPRAERVQSVYDEFGLREYGKETMSVEGDKVVVTFHLGFMDELAPQTGLWVEDSEGNFVKTLYVSGFSGYAKEKQVNLPEWAKSSDFETDGTTGASIDWGKHSCAWDLADHQGKRVEDGLYRVNIEVSWWPSMKYGRASAEIRVGKTPDEVTVEKGPFIPWLHVQYLQ